MVVWAPVPGTQAILRGIHLPSLRKFVIPLPLAAWGISAIALSSRHVYVYTGTLWSGAIP